jgi:hypothetical protein
MHCAFTRILTLAISSGTSDVRFSGPSDQCTGGGGDLAPYMLCYDVIMEASPT